jgi:eukaryotic-like serine/threonine-protein kinase
MILHKGDILDGKFQIIDRIAVGGMGEVYKGINIDLSRPVAIKVLTKPSQEFTYRFIREAQSMAALDHSNIVPIYALGSHSGYHYFVMKFVLGETLEHLLKRQRLELDSPFTIDRVVEIICTTFRALDHAHRRGILHRDIKPGNIIIDTNGQPILMDFGIVKRIEDSRVTQTGVIFGTPQYMSPEQAMGMSQSAATDVYALGILTFEMLAGRLPFVAGSVYQMLLAHVNQSVPDLCKLNPLVPAWLGEVVKRMLEKNPEDRYGSANEVVKVIESHRESAPNDSKPALPGLAKVPIIIEKKSSSLKLHTGRYDGVVTKHKRKAGWLKLSRQTQLWGLIAFGVVALIGVYLFIEGKS